MVPAYRVLPVAAVERRTVLLDFGIVLPEVGAAAADGIFIDIDGLPRRSIAAWKQLVQLGHVFVPLRLVG